MPMTKDEYHSLVPLCAGDQLIKLDAYFAEQSNVGAARLIGVAESNIRRAIKSLRYKADQIKLQNGKNEPLDSFPVKGATTLYDEDGNVKLNWVKRDKAKDDYLQDFKDAIEAICDRAEGKYEPKRYNPPPNQKEFLPVYISNDVHIGAMMWSQETRDRDYDTQISVETFQNAIDDLVERSPSTKECIVADLGDLTEMDDFKNATPQSGHNLDVDGRYSRVLDVAQGCIAYFIEKALEKHDVVHFINISGNHDITTGHSIRSFIKAWFRNEPRVVVDTSPAFQKYFRYGSTLLGFAHGDGLKMHNAGEVMAMHNERIWSETKDRYYHFGHNHKDSVVDGRLCKAESHRNIAPLNAWASHAGFGRQAGTMKCIIYDKNLGEYTRITHKVVF